MAIDLDGRAWVAPLVVTRQLLKDGNPDASVMGDLVSDADRLETRRLLDGVNVTEEPRVDLPDSSRDVNRIQLDVESRKTSTCTIGIADVQDVVVETNLVDVQNKIDHLGNLLLGGDLPLAWSELSGQSWKTKNCHPVLLRLVDHPITEL